MNMATKNDIFQEKLSEYVKADRTRKGEILDAVCEVTSMHRKAAMRRFRVLQCKDGRLPERRGRSTYYTPDVTAALKDVWEAADEPCGVLLHPMIHEYVETLIRDCMWQHGDEATAKLRAMKEHTVRRRVSAFMKSRPRAHGLSGTKPSHLKSIILIFKGPWRDLGPGNGQLDTVAHCGDTLRGDYIHTVSYIDAPTYWIVSRAQWNKGQEATRESMKAIKERLPVAWVGAHPDTGSEYINWLVKDWCDAHHINLSRSEPNKKNDNMYIEERNGHVVRKYLGYTRFDDRTLVPLVNELYDVLGLYLNHFQAVRRTVEKVRIGARYKRTYEHVPLTPYARMLAHADVPDTVKEGLRAAHAALNPLVLKRRIDTLITKIMRKQRAHGTVHG